jgi:prophage DNA circulation protein
MKPASFRGVAFSVTSTDGDVGRRNIIHEYPLRDLPNAEDLGRKARTFSIEAFIIGADYMVGRDQLIAALEQSGAGELVHPYRGRQQVVVTSARVSESTTEGGLARFALTFTESGQPLAPINTVDTGSVVDAAANNAAASAKNGFASLFDVSGFQDFVNEAGLGELNDSLHAISQQANEFLSNGLLPEFTNQIFGIASSLQNLMMFPANLAASVYGQIESLAGIANTPLMGITALENLFNYGLNAAAVNSVTPSTRQQAVNQTAVIMLIKQAAVIEAARLSSRITPASKNDALALQAVITTQLELLAETASDELYTTLTALRIAVIQDITARAANLAVIVAYDVPVTMPALIVAYQLYGASAAISDWADSICTRNKIGNPGFVPGGQSIEVLTSVGAA